MCMDMWRMEGRKSFRIERQTRQGNMTSKSWKRHTKVVSHSLMYTYSTVSHHPHPHPSIHPTAGGPRWMMKSREDFRLLHQTSKKVCSFLPSSIFSPVTTSEMDLCYLWLVLNQNNCPAFAKKVPHFPPMYGCMSWYNLPDSSPIHITLVCDCVLRKCDYFPLKCTQQ